MKIIIAPTKKMTTNLEAFVPKSTPKFINEAQEILSILNEMSISDLQIMWKTSDKLTQEAFQQLKDIDFKKANIPAITAYVGIQYQYMAPDLFTEPALSYIDQNLRILSGFYGSLRPFDGIVNYRLEMQNKLPINKKADLYEFWNHKIYDSLELEDKDTIINLASKEYSDIVRPYLTKNQKMIDIIFASQVNGKLKVKATLAKMARGMMVRYLAENNILNPHDIKNFNHPDFKYSAEHSNDTEIIFLNQK